MNVVFAIRGLAGIIFIISTAIQMTTGKRILYLYVQTVMLKPIMEYLKKKSF